MTLTEEPNDKEVSSWVLGSCGPLPQGLDLGAHPPMLPDGPLIPPISTPGASLLSSLFVLSSSFIRCGAPVS